MALEISLEAEKYSLPQTMAVCLVASGNQTKNLVNPIDPVRKLLDLCLNNYEVISNTNKAG